jgi:hypothetical protein
LKTTPVASKALKVKPEIAVKMVLTDRMVLLVLRAVKVKLVLLALLVTLDETVPPVNLVCRGLPVLKARKGQWV